MREGSCVLILKLSSMTVMVIRMIRPVLVVLLLNNHPIALFCTFGS